MGITINYTIEVKHEFDYIAEEDHKMKMFKTGSRSSSKLLHEGSKSFLEEESIIKLEKKNEVHQPFISIHSPLKKNETLSDII